MRKEAEEFPAQLKKEAQAATAEAARTVEARFEQQILILKKDGEAERRVFDLHVKTLEETVSRQAAQIATLEKQLGEAKQPKALSNINQIAMKQAKNRPQG